MAYIHPSLRVGESGPPTGQEHKGRSIPAWIERDGAHWDFARVAHDDPDGSTPLSQLRSDECVIAPGLVYRRAR